MSHPILAFHRLYPQARPPERADRAAGGTMPTRAFRWCEAITQASSFGWYVFAPMDFSLMWDGADVFWTCDLLDDWVRLEAAQLPDMAATFDAAAPETARGFSPPFLTALPEPGHVQVWTGLIARTAEDWSLHIRGPANVALPGGYSLFEGIVETDRWCGPLFANLRLTRTGVPVHFTPDTPLLQVQPLPRLALAEATQSAVRLHEIETLDWPAYHSTIVAPALQADRRPGQYAVEARKRARCPVHQRAEVELV